MPQKLVCLGETAEKERQYKYEPNVFFKEKWRGFLTYNLKP